MDPKIAADLRPSADGYAVQFCWLLMFFAYRCLVAVIIQSSESASSSSRRCSERHAVIGDRVDATDPARPSSRRRRRRRLAVRRFVPEFIIIIIIIDVFIVA